MTKVKSEYHTMGKGKSKGSKCSTPFTSHKYCDIRTYFKYMFYFIDYSVPVGKFVSVNYF